MDKWKVKADSRDRKARLRRSADMVVVNRSLKSVILAVIAKGAHRGRKPAADQEGEPEGR
jgi:hypothetical protein